MIAHISAIFYIQLQDSLRHPKYYYGHSGWRRPLIYYYRSDHFKSGNKKEPGLNNPGSFHLVSKRGHQIYFTNNLNSAPTHHYFYRSQIVVMESSNSSAV